MNDADRDILEELVARFRSLHGEMGMRMILVHSDVAMQSWG
ncbi:hypothetical protein ACMAVI_001755 [Burkholderia cenocepacia]